MYKNKKNFIIFAIVAIIISFGITFFYHKYEEKKLEKNIEVFTESLLGKEPKREKGIFTKLKDSLFGSEEKKIEKKLNKKLEELNEIEKKYMKEEEKVKKEKLSEDYKNILEDVSKLQNDYYSLTGIYYELEAKEIKNDKKTIKNIENLEVNDKNLPSLEEEFKESLRNTYINNGYLLKNTSLFQKAKNIFSSSKVENFENENYKVKIIYEDNLTKVEEYIDGRLIKEVVYKTEDNYSTITVRIEDKEKEFVRTLENIKSGYGLDKLKDGSKVEFRHENQVLSGPAVKYYTNGDREEFIYHNNKKHGFSTYYFSNGDKEEVYYVENQLEGKAKYTYADGYVEIYKYKNGKREE